MGMMPGMPAGFWDYVFDNEYRQRRDIEELRDYESAVAGGISSLGGYTQQLRAQVNSLSVLVSVLVRMLEDSGHLDTKVLQYRVEAMLEEQAAAAQAHGPVDLGDALNR
jgi:hypothetical protein